MTTNPPTSLEQRAFAANIIIAKNIAYYDFMIIRWFYCSDDVCYPSGEQGDGK